MVEIKRGSVYLANLSPGSGTEPGKVRPVLVIQTDLLNKFHPSTIICPLTTNVIAESKILRVHIKKGQAGLDRNSDLLIDQIRAIDNKRFLKFLGHLPYPIFQKVIVNLIQILDIAFP
ncbi:MAG: type II toxin-antitoxin system PemK/MazF family toxin [Elusimicrobia bacterium]|nr:type II toxin-antitoxin system PemK/MazF family toxin [Elusimicrobiota bacterium]